MLQLDPTKRDQLLREAVSVVTVFDLRNEYFEDTGGVEQEVFFMDVPTFVSNYQSRIYVKNMTEAFDANGEIRIDLMIEFVAEIFREYYNNPDQLKANFPKYYDLIEEAIK